MNEADSGGFSRRMPAFPVGDPMRLVILARATCGGFRRASPVYFFELTRLAEIAAADVLKDIDSNDLGRQIRVFWAGGCVAVIDAN